MNKIFINTIFLMSLLCVMSGCSNQQENNEGTSEDVHHIRIAHVTSESDPMHLSWEYFKEKLEEKSEGRIQVDIYGGGQLANSDREVAEAVQKNVFQVGSAPSYSIAGVAGLSEYLLFDVPYLFKNDNEIYEITDGPIGEEFGEHLHQNTGLRQYGSYSIGWVKLTNNDNEISQPGDIDGISARTTESEFYMELMESWGGNPTPMSFGEVFTALQQGTVDGLMTTTNLIRTNGFFEVQEYLTTVDPFAIVHVPVVNNEFYEELPDDLQVIFDEVMYEDYLPKAREEHAKAEENSFEILQDEGVEIYNLTDDEKDEFMKHSNHIIDEKKDIIGEDLVNEVTQQLNK